MPYHAGVSGAELHVFARVTGTDPGAIGAGKGWVDTSSGPPYQLKIRNSGDSGWENVGIIGSYALAADLTTHTGNTSNPHSVTAAQVGAMVNPMTTQADIIVGGISGAPARLAKGANNTVLGVDGSGVFGYKADPSGGSGGHTIEDEGTPLTARAALNFVGAGVAVTDDAGNDATVVTISGGGGGGGGALDDLSDVDTTGAAAGKLLAYDDSDDTWKPATIDTYQQVSDNLVRVPTSGTATYYADDVFSSSFSAAHAADGNYADGWAMTGWNGNEYWEVTWSVAQSLTRVVLTGRPTAQFGSGKLIFSDASEVPFPVIPTGVPTTIEFARKTGITSMRVQTLASGAGAAGLSEVEAYNVTTVVNLSF